MKFFLNFYIIFLLLSSFLIFSLVPTQALATAKEQFSSSLDKTALGTGHTGSSVTLPTMIGTVIKVALSLVGIVILILMLYGGFIWMNARGNETEVEKAKKILQNSIIGLMIILSAYAITNLVGKISTDSLDAGCPPGQSKGDDDKCSE